MGSNLYAKQVDINKKISLVVPDVGYVIDNEDDYYRAIYCIVATPFDMMVQLDDCHIDFTKITEFDLFCLLFEDLKRLDTTHIFKNLDLSKFEIVLNENTQEIIIRDEENDITIDRVIHSVIADKLRSMLRIEKNDKRPGNEEARIYLLDRERRKLERLKKKKEIHSHLENYIVALVNTSEFPYNYETVRGISIFQFYASLEQVIHKISYDNLMAGYYAGTINGDDLTKADKTFIRDN